MASYEEDYDAIAAYEDEHDCVDEDDYIMVFPTAPPTSTPSAAVGADTSSSSSPSPYARPSAAASSQCDEPDTAEMAAAAAAEADARDMNATAAAAAEVEARDMIAMAAAEVNAALAAAQGVVATAAPLPPPSAAWRNKHSTRGWADAEADDEEVTDDDEEDEEDYMYQAYYDRADRGRSRHVKRSSGRRGRTKKASTIGRPRGEGHLSHTAGGHAYAYAY